MLVIEKRLLLLSKLLFLIAVSCLLLPPVIAYNMPLSGKLYVALNIVAWLIVLANVVISLTTSITAFSAKASATEFKKKFDRYTIVLFFIAMAVQLFNTMFIHFD